MRHWLLRMCRSRTLIWEAGRDGEEVGGDALKSSSAVAQGTFSLVSTAQSGEEATVQNIEGSLFHLTTLPETPGLKQCENSTKVKRLGPRRLSDLHGESRERERGGGEGEGLEG